MMRARPPCRGDFRTSSAHGNELSVADQQAKLELIVRTARQVWG